MPNTPSKLDPTIRQPNSAQLMIIGGAAMLGIGLWAATIVVVALVEPTHLTPILMALGGSTALVTATVLGSAYVRQRAVGDDHGLILESMGQIAREQEQLSERIKQIDPMAIYAAVAGDLLRQDRP